MYLDYASTTPLKKEVKDYIIDLLDVYQNPSSAYQSGSDVKHLIQKARNNVAKFINADAEDIVFTSSGSASNTLMITGYQDDYTLYYSPTMHKSALKTIESLHDRMCIKLKVNEVGMIDFEYLEQWLKFNPVKPFVVMEYANSEIGTVQLVEELINLVHEHNGIICLDCTGSIPYIQLDVKKLNPDVVTFSAHKLGALKGCGVLYYNRKKLGKLKPLIYGSQENGLFGGTENVLGICALGKAVENYNYSSISDRNREYVLNYILKNISKSYLIGSHSSRLPNNLYMCFKGISGESLMMLLDVNGIQVSTGSACNEKSIEQSSTLLAIGLPKEDLNSCIRMTFSGNETIEQLDYLCGKLKQNIEMLRELNEK